MSYVQIKRKKYEEGVKMMKGTSTGGRSSVDRLVSKSGISYD